VIDVDDRLRGELDRLVDIDPRPDWEEVKARAGLKRERARRTWALVAAVGAVAVIVGTATPLGSAIVRGLDDFSTWLSGQPGSPVSEEEQREFDAANARSWLGFPHGTKLRRLITHEVEGATVDLLGFRSGSSTLCLRLTVTGKTRTSTLSCAPLAELRREGGPARVLLADHTVGKGDKTAWYGIDRIHSANLQITAGIVSDGVTNVVLEDDAGRHEVKTASNAFLYVDEDPDVGQRVKRVSARTASGLVPVPFAPAPFGFGGGVLRRDVPPAPTVARHITGGRIGWLEDREPRGEPLDVLPERTFRGMPPQSVPPPRHAPASPTNVLFGRVLAPDPDRRLRLVLTLNAHRPNGPPAGLCTWLVTSRSGGAGGCAPYPDVFEHSLISATGMGGGSGAFLTVTGVATDDVARIEALFVDGQRADVALEDNAFLVDLPRAKLPARLIAYDSDDRVISVSHPWSDFGGGPSPAKGRARSLLRVSGANGARAELLVGPATGGGECMYIKHFVDARHAGMSLSCRERSGAHRALEIGSQFQPPRFVGGRVREDVETVRIRFADGTSAMLTPTRGYVLWAAPAERLVAGKAAVGAEGLDEHGNVVDRISFKPPSRSGN
jgi:hypothetical protein